MGVSPAGEVVARPTHTLGGIFPGWGVSCSHGPDKALSGTLWDRELPAPLPASLHPEECPGPVRPLSPPFLPQAELCEPRNPGGWELVWSPSPMLKHLSNKVHEKGSENAPGPGSRAVCAPRAPWDHPARGPARQPGGAKLVASSPAPELWSLLPTSGTPGPAPAGVSGCGGVHMQSPQGPTERGGQLSPPPPSPHPLKQSESRGRSGPVKPKQ